MNSKASNKAINIFNYFGYREYLSDVYDLLKEKRYGYSYRVFSKEAGISSHNFLPRILKNQRNLTSEFIPKLVDYLKLSLKEAKYLQALVAFNNAKKPSAKEQFLKQLLSVRVANEEFRIEDDKLHFFDRWYYPVVRELVVICDFQQDYNKLARNCIPRITAQQAKSAVAFLMKNNLIKKDANGRYAVTDAIIATEPEVDSAIIPKYHRITMRQCVDSIDIIKKEDRNFSSSTLLVSKKLYEEIKKEIYQFRKRLLSMAKDCRDPEMVCYTGFQLLPRSELIPNEPGTHVHESENGSYEIL
jgi:uncharacterized protein (TIGR02147 family)